MAAGSFITPFTVWKVVNNPTGTPQTKRLLEKATQTFKQGVPVVAEVGGAGGYLIESPTLSSALTIAGMSQEAGANLTTSGVAKVLTQGSVQNQSSAVIIPGGAWPNDGKCGVWIADNNTIFIGSCDSAHTPAITDLGAIYGITKDGTTGFWYIDTSITAAGSGAIAEITEIPTIPGNPAAPLSGPVAGGLLAFRITKAGQQFGI